MHGIGRSLTRIFSRRCSRCFYKREPNKRGSLLAAQISFAGPDADLSGALRDRLIPGPTDRFVEMNPIKIKQNNFRRQRKRE